MRLTDAQIKEIQQRADAATPGPWRYDEDAQWVFGPTDNEHICDIRGIGACLPQDNGEFIAHCRDDVQALLESLAEVRLDLGSMMMTLIRYAREERTLTPEEMRKILYATGWAVPHDEAGERIAKWAMDRRRKLERLLVLAVEAKKATEPVMAVTQRLNQALTQYGYDSPEWRIAWHEFELLKQDESRRDMTTEYASLRDELAAEKVEVEL